MSLSVAHWDSLFRYFKCVIPPTSSPSLLFALAAAHVRLASELCCQQSWSFSGHSANRFPFCRVLWPCLPVISYLSDNTHTHRHRHTQTLVSAIYYTKICSICSKNQQRPQAKQQQTQNETKTEIRAVYILVAFWANSCSISPEKVSLCCESFACCLPSCYRYKHSSDTDTDTARAEICSSYLPMTMFALSGSR